MELLNILIQRNPKFPFPLLSEKMMMRKCLWTLVTKSFLKMKDVTWNWSKKLRVLNLETPNNLILWLITISIFSYGIVEERLIKILC